MLANIKSCSTVFVARVFQDMELEAFHLTDPDGEGNFVISKYPHLCTPRKGIYATLLGGMWLVKDRLLQVRLKEGIEGCVGHIQDLACAKVSAAIPDQKDLLDAAEVSHLKTMDCFAYAIQAIENQCAHPNEPLEGAVHEGLKKCASREPSIKHCLKTHLPGWQLNEVKATSELWQRCADALRAFRSSTSCGKTRLRVIDMLPKITSEEPAKEFMSFLDDMTKDSDSEDISHFLERSGYASVVTANVPAVLGLAGQILTKLSTVAWVYSIYLFLPCAGVLRHVRKLSVMGCAIFGGSRAC